jgi:6-phosphogluconate dehydrogenase
MPGGQKEAYELVAPILEQIAALLKMVSRVLPISVLTVLVIM